MKCKLPQLHQAGKLFLRGLCLCLAALLLMTGCVAKLPDDGENPGVDTGKDEEATPGGTGEMESEQYKPTDLKINLLEDPFGVERTDLCFSWAMGATGKNVKQTAYRIIVAKSAALMEAGTLVYDSDWITSAENTAVALSSLKSLLADNALYYWSVQVQDNRGVTSELSDPQAFTTAVGSKWADTHGIWAGQGGGGQDVTIANYDDWSDYAMDVEFIIDSNALGFTVRAMNTANFYMWQFKVDKGTAMLYPHVYQNGAFVGNKAIASVTIPKELAFDIGDTIKARIVCDGSDVQTYLANASGDYVLVDDRDMSEYDFDEGIVGVRTGGSEWGRVLSMVVHHPTDESKVLYHSAFEHAHNPFNRCTVEDGVLVVPKALSTTNMISAEQLMVVSRAGKATDDFAFLRTELDIPADKIAALDRAVLSVTALSPEGARQFVYNMYVNGVCVGVGPSRLNTNADGEKELYYNSYDVTELLSAGKNALAAINYTTADKLFLSQLTLHYADGTSEVISNSARDAKAWNALAADAVFGKDNSIGTAYYTAHANNIDSALYPYGFAEVGFDDSAWASAFVDADLAGGMLLIPSETDPVTRYDADAEVTVTQLNDGSYVIDLGKEIIGGVRFVADLPAAATLSVYYGEQLNEDGSVKYAMLTGNTYAETWKLTQGKQTIETIDMLAYRYIQIVGCPVKVTPEMVCGLEIRAAYDDEDASFDSDHDLLNDIYAMMDHTVRTTTQDLYVDSQSRERLAYEGDLIINLLAAYAFEDDYSVGRFTAEYLYTHRTWPAEYLLFTAMIAMDDYMETGDARSIQEYYDIIKSRVYTDKISEEYGLISTGVSGTSKNDAVLVDWPSQERDEYDMSVEYNTVLNCVAVLAYEKLADVAEVAGKSADVTAFRKLAADLRSTLISELYDAEQGAFADGLSADGTVSGHYSQHATAYALACGVYSDQSMADAMAQTLREQGKIRMSVYGSFFLLKGLYESGNGDVANMLLLDGDTAEDARTWAKMIYTLGATITAEAWGEKNKNNLTFSHPWGAAPAYAIKNGIFGINPTSAGYATFDVRFSVDGIGKAELTVPTIKGGITASFDTADGFAATVVVPANTEATVYLPAQQGATLTVDGSATDAVNENGYLVITVGSGTWKFTVQ